MKKSGLQFNSAMFAKMLAEAEGNIENMKKALFQRLAKIGETVVAVARDNGDYTDRTGNLRSSIGYMIVMDGEIMTMSKGKPTPAPEGNGSAGIQANMELLEKLKSELPESGAVLVVTAGMNYAWYVENLYGKDVLASAELKAEQLLNKLFTQS